MQQALDDLCRWADKWAMQFNVKKCKVMHVGHGNKGAVYTMNGQNLEKTEEERDIGVTVCNNLKPGSQCRKAARTAQTVLGQLARAFHFPDRHIFVRLYTTYVRPHLVFATPAWAPWQAADKEVLEKVQKRAVNMVSGLRPGTYEEKLSELGLCSLEERRHQQDMVQVHKIMGERDGMRRETWFTMAADGGRATRATEDPLNIRPGRSRLEVRSNFFSQRVAEAWNAIPPSLKQAKTATAFRRGYQTLRERR